MNTRLELHSNKLRGNDGRETHEESVYSQGAVAPVDFPRPEDAQAGFRPERGSGIASMRGT